MFAANLPADPERAAFMLVLSLACLIVGLIWRRNPERVLEYSRPIDGSVYLFGDDVYLRVIRLSGTSLVWISFASLFAAARLF